MPDRHEILSRDTAGRFSGARHLTDMQERFVRELVRTGCTAAQAARRAGYGDADARAYELRRNPRVLDAIHQLQRQELNELANHSLVVARQILTGELDAPVKVRADTAFRVLDRAGHSVQAAKPADEAGGRSLDEMSVAELEAFIRRGRQAQQEADRPMIESTTAPQNFPTGASDQTEPSENCGSE